MLHADEQKSLSANWMEARLFSLYILFGLTLKKKWKKCSLNFQFNYTIIPHRTKPILCIRAADSMPDLTDSWAVSSSMSSPVAWQPVDDSIWLKHQCHKQPNNREELGKVAFRNRSHINSISFEEQKGVDFLVLFLSRLFFLFLPFGGGSCQGLRGKPCNIDRYNLVSSALKVDYFRAIHSLLKCTFNTGICYCNT